MNEKEITVSQRDRQETLGESLKKETVKDDERVGEKTVGEMNHLELVMELRKHIHVSQYRDIIKKPTDALRKILAYYESPMKEDKITPEEEAELTLDKRMEEADQRDRQD
jgi:hypothetical protein